jgi:hypothetical protein
MELGNWLFKRVLLGCTNMEWAGSIWVEGVTGSVSASTMLGRYPCRDALLFSKSALFYNALENL